MKSQRPTNSDLRNPVVSVVRQFHGIFGGQGRKARKNGPKSGRPECAGKSTALVQQKITDVGAREILDVKNNRIDKQPETRKEILLRSLPDHQVWRNFVEIMQIPRQSFKEWQIRDWAAKLGKALGCEVQMDSVGNLRLRRPPSPGYEDSPKIAIQAHLDMVCEAVPGKLHNFDRDPIHGIVRDGWLFADGTTLGADNGVGVAAAIAILQDPYLQAGQIEILLTVAEEKDMRGAANIDKKLLDSDILINVDSESEHEICAGSAGGFGKTLKRQAEQSPRQGGEVSIRMEISNLAGGHTGVNIHEGHANALVVWARLMDKLSESGIEARIVSLTGGSAHNAIPRQVKASIFISQEDVADAQAILHRHFKEINLEYDGFECRNWEFIISQPETTYDFGLKPTESQDLVDLILQIPDGVDRMNAGNMEGVESSMTLSKARVDPLNGEYTLELFARSSSPSRLRFLNRRLDAIARSRNAEASEQLRPFPSWSPKTDSAILKHALESHNKLFKKKAKIFSVHAGLECGILSQAYPHLDTISIGPTILGAHTPEERIKVDSVIPFYDWLKEIVLDAGKSGGVLGLKNKFREQG
eukprot:1340516-Amorphochlora_amoeboformis.AAC.1